LRSNRGSQFFPTSRRRAVFDAIAVPFADHTVLF
jgi:hypothetical protein